MSHVFAQLSDNQKSPKLEIFKSYSTDTVPIAVCHWNPTYGLPIKYDCIFWQYRDSRSPVQS